MEQKTSTVDGQSNSEYEKLKVLLLFLFTFLHSSMVYESAEVATDTIKSDLVVR